MLSSPMESSFTALLLLVMLCILSIANSFTPNISYFIDCGSKTSNTLLNNNPARTFEADDLFLYGKNNFALSNMNISFTGSLYSIAHVSSSNFKYSFNTEPNSYNILRLHFLPFITQSCDLSTATFSDTVSPTIKEFFLWTDTGNLDVEFIPVKNSLAFVSAIEAFTAPKELLSGRNPISVGTSITTLNGGLSKQILETMYRVNMPGPLVTPDNDTLWRTWVTDDPYIYGAVLSKNYTVSMGLNYDPSKGRSEEIAPPIVYSTAREINISNITSDNINIKITWSFSVSSGYKYLIRLHFCDITSDDLNQGLAFTIYVMDYVALPNLVPSEYTTKILQPFYIDFMVDVTSAENITVGIDLHSFFYQNNIRQYAFLNGLEIMKVNSLRSTSDSFNGNKKLLPMVVVGASIGIVIIIALAFASYKKRHRKPTQGAKKKTSANLGLLMPFSQIEIATNNFDEKNLIGVGGFGKVYKGVLSDGTEVAVKRASPQSQQGLPEFQTEIEILSRIRHDHLVSLIGYCNEHSEMIIVYEYMQKGPLRNYLYGREVVVPLSWKQRLDICIQAAKGLHYLHTGYSTKIIHRDIKSTNILLGDNFVAKLSDFGLSKLGASMDETHVSTFVKGTFGYLDPEYFLTQQLTDKSDVYSFGVTLLEVLCARRVIDQSLPLEEINLAEWALMSKREGQLKQVIDPRIVGEINENSLLKFWEIVEKCLQDYVSDRPDMGEVLRNLEDCLQLQEMDDQDQDISASGETRSDITNSQSIISINLE